MKKQLTVGLLMSLSILSAAADLFYYTMDGQRASLVSSTQKVLARQSSDEVVYPTNQENKKNGVFFLSVDELVLGGDGNLYTGGVMVDVFPAYTTEYGLELGVIDSIIIKFKKNISSEAKAKVIKQFDLKLINEGRIYNIYRVVHDGDPLEVSTQIYELDVAEYCLPDFFVTVENSRHIPNDEYFNMQIALHNTGQVSTDGHTGSVDADIDAPEAWNITKGSSNIIIAVVDHGVTPDHPDIPNSRQVHLYGADFVTGGYPLTGSVHGDACAGVIAATMDNNEGIAGVAPHCKIMPIRISISGEPSPISDLADSITFAADNGAHIISCSWGLSCGPPDAFPVIVDAIQDAIDSGVVVVFAVGNGANHVSDVGGCIQFPANVNIPEVLSVGASDRYDLQANYSPTSNPSLYNRVIDLVAPSHRAYSFQIPGENPEMWTTDVPGPAGYNLAVGNIPSSGTNYLAYTGRFGGTSYSCPVVAGVAALVLSINPDLTPSEVKDILLSSANKVGGYTYDGNGWSAEMGHGRVNAFNSVMNACPVSYNIDWNIVNGQDITYQAGDYITAEGNILAGAIVELRAENSVRLTNGFHAVKNSSVKVYLQPCGTVLMD